MFIKNGVELLVGGYEIYVECERLKNAQLHTRRKSGQAENSDRNKDRAREIPNSFPSYLLGYAATLCSFATRSTQQKTREKSLERLWNPFTSRGDVLRGIEAVTKLTFLL